MSRERLQWRARTGWALLLAVAVCVGLGWGKGRKAAPGSADEPDRRMVERVCRDIASIRGMQFREPVGVAAQSRPQFIEYLESEIDRQYGQTGLDTTMRGLVRVGAVKQMRDLGQLLIEMLSSQAAAYYDPEDGVYRLLATNMPPYLLEGIASHELCHALQDQHHDLKAFLEGGDVRAMLANGDAALARQSLAEGEATLVMLAWMLKEQAGASDPALVDELASAAIASHAAIGLDTFLDLAASGGLDGMAGMEDMGAALLDLKRFPRFFVETMYSAYMRGAVMVDRVKSAGGWQAVTELYSRPPRSMEQVLHPEKLRAPRDEPVDVGLRNVTRALGADWRLVEEDVLGELGIRVMLRVWEDPGAPDAEAAASAAAGWGGDRYGLFVRKADEQQSLLAWRTAWDTDADAAEFSVAYRLCLAERFPEARAADRSQPGAKVAWQLWEVEPGRFLRLSRAGKSVSVLDTTDRLLFGSIME